MYSNDKKYGFSILDIIVKIILFGLFIFILVWLFNKKVPNMTPFYSNVFRENIKYMQEAGESYFTDDKMPKEVGQEVKMTLSQMIDKKLIIPFVDEDGNSCDVYNSYVSITKQEDESYQLKTNLKCNTEEDYTIKILGCHTYCKDNSCEKKCYKEQITSYQYKQEVTNTTTKYSCKAGYSLNGKYCYKTVLSDSYNGEIKVTENKTIVEDALSKVESGSKVELNTIINVSKQYKDKIKSVNKEYTEKLTNVNKEYIEKLTNTKKEYTEKVTGTKKEYTNVITNTTTSTKKQYTDVIVNKTEDKTTCVSGGYTNSYACNCTGSWSGGQYHTVCSTCTEYIPTESCSTTPGTTTYTCPSGYTKEGTGSSTKCYKNVTTYSCPSGYTKEGSGSSLKCYKNVTTYSCPKGYTTEGSGSSLKCYIASKVYSCPSGYTAEGTGSKLKCYKNVTTYSCPSGYTKEGSESKLKCYKNVTTYSCPTEANHKEGSDASLKCYKVVEGTVSYYCKDASYTLNGTKCSKVVKEEKTKYECSEGYKLEGTVCKKYTTDKVKADAQKVTNKSYKYTWSTSTSLSGWTKTGKTKIIEGKEICE